ncbi:hypothetical protein BBN63_32925 [Streptomyces niveus]|uniref:Uncharacterized protein n=1 Tax=Streptomyces niveus TaxID=193462 RepID=A0A1U9R227_STRNV|nr:hypothetical protein BBN63_32925 [Streptomyces niveus]
MVSELAQSSSSAVDLEPDGLRVVRIDIDASVGPLKRVAIATIIVGGEGPCTKRPHGHGRGVCLLGELDGFLAVCLGDGGPASVNRHISEQAGSLCCQVEDAAAETSWLLPLDQLLKN